MKLRNINIGYSLFFSKGDDDQSIYAFRGAQCVNNIDEYLKELYLERENPEHIIKLEQNYREIIN
jgi:superfamily I DNA/RNA helicase